MPERWSGYIAKPVNRERATWQSDGYDPGSILQRWQNEISEEPGLKVILDLDENLFNTAGYWADISNRFLRLFASVQQVELPDARVVCEEGGPGFYYPAHFSEVFPTPQTYELLADELRHRRPVNLLGKPLVDISKVIDTVNSSALLLGGLTARPDTQIVIQATRQQLRNVRANFDVVYRPDNTLLTDASRQKLEILTQLANTPEATGVVVLIDDSISTATAIQGYNKARSSGRPIIQIVFGSGPLTKPRIDRGEFKPDIKNGIFLMNDWDDVAIILEEVNRWVKSQSL